jgi:Tfp pilus assembly protein PilE
MNQFAIFWRMISSPPHRKTFTPPCPSRRKRHQSLARLGVRRGGRAKGRAGLTLIEMVLAGVILAMVALAIANFFPGFLNLPRRLMARHQANTAARICMSTIVQALRQGEANSIQISTPAGAPPNSTISFWTVNHSTYTIAWSATPVPNSVNMTINKPGGITQVMTLAQNVVTLSFTLDYRDPSLISVSLQVSIPTDSTGNFASQQTPIFLPSETVQLISGGTI